MSDTETAYRQVYCFDGDDGAYDDTVHYSGDPHAVILALDEEDARRWSELAQADKKLGKWTSGTPIEVTDQETGLRYMLATAPCGLGCRCAAVARKA